MATYTATAGNVSLSSKWTCIYAPPSVSEMSARSTASATRTFYFGGIPAGSTIHSATLYGDLGSPYTGAALRTADGAAFNGSKAVSASPGGSLTVTFAFRANGELHSHNQSHTSTLDITNLRVVVEYTAPDGSGGTTPPPSGGASSGNFSSPMTVMEAGETYRCTVTGVPNRWHRVTVSVLGRQFIQNPLENQTYTMVTAVQMAWLTALPNAAYTTLTATCTQYAEGDNTGQNPLWTRTLTCRVNVPDSVVPTIEDFTIQRDDNGVPGDMDIWVQGYSKAELTAVNPQGAYGSTIKRYSITGGGLNASTASAVHGPIPISGDITYKLVVTDSRGRTVEAEQAITVLPYARPVLTGVEMWRSDHLGAANREGTWARLRAMGNGASLDGQNILTLEGRVYIRGATPSAWQPMTSGVPLIAGGGALLVNKSYVAEIRLSDKLNSTQAQAIIPTDTVALNFLDGAMGGAVGKYAERPGVMEIVWPIVSPNITQDNILHNWDFRQPVNQRGVSGTISTVGYFLDRWRLVSGTVTVNAGDLEMAAGAVIEQRIEGNLLAGKQVTVSVLLSDDTIKSGTGTMPTTAGTVGVTVSGWGTITLGYGTGYMYVRISPTAAATMWAAKCELGADSTLAADGPMDYGRALTDCLRFLYAVKVAETDTLMGTGVKRTGTIYDWVIPLGNMRTRPTLVHNATKENMLLQLAIDNLARVISAVAVVAFSPSAVTLQLTLSFTQTNGTGIVKGMLRGGVPFEMALSAEL